MRTTPALIALATASVLLATLLASPAWAADACGGVRSLSPSCTGGAIAQDTVSGTCRTITCASGSSSMRVMACDKPDGASPQFFELYKQAQAGTQVSSVCLNGTCVGTNGFAKSAQYSCGAAAPLPQPPACTRSLEICDGKDNDCDGRVDESDICAPIHSPNATCSATVKGASVTCAGGTITRDAMSGTTCRSVVCGSGGNAITVLACDKSGGAYEVYRQSFAGSPPKVCVGSACVQGNGFAKSTACAAPGDGTNGTSPTMPPQTNTTTPPVGTYPLKTDIVSTIFWAGQGPSADTGWTHNYDSAWDTWWQEHYGGYDDPNNRNGYHPAGFTPKENPFYVAVPYTDFGNAGRKADAFDVVPWADEKSSWGSQESMIKNRWVRIVKGTKVAYAQVENSGPGPTDDWRYVFGSDPRPNTDFGWKAGIDVSPAVRDYLGLGPVDKVSWQWVDASQVPAGPWKQIVTTRQSCWASTMCP